ncbi:hypothetical protein ANO11243_096860 [Dothideomycetidae sp. 11243]|nr:hypothetical protein ANO11243_096860 [fungal sp. No.11243]
MVVTALKPVNLLQNPELYGSGNYYFDDGNATWNAVHIAHWQSHGYQVQHRSISKIRNDTYAPQVVLTVQPALSTGFFRQKIDSVIHPDSYNFSWWDIAQVGGNYNRFLITLGDKTIMNYTLLEKNAGDVLDPPDFRGPINFQVKKEMKKNTELSFQLIGSWPTRVDFGIASWLISSPKLERID